MLGYNGDERDTIVRLSFQDWVFLGRFCFLSGYGLLKYNISFPKVLSPVELLLYYDAPGPMEALHGSDLVRILSEERKGRCC